MDSPATRNRPRSFEAGKPDAGVAWADALRGAVAVATAAWSPRRGRALRVAVAFGDEAGGRFGGGRRRAQRRFRTTRPGFRRLPFLSPSNLVPCRMRAVPRRPNWCRVVTVGREREGMERRRRPRVLGDLMHHVPSVVQWSVSGGT